jgi:tetratricopeptide (TPR) repeat protein
LEASIFLVFILAVQGRISESEKAIDAARGRTRDPYYRARCDIYHAFNLRAKGQLQEAVRSLEKIKEHYPQVKQQIAFAELQASLIWCTMGKTKQAKASVLCAQKADPGYYGVAKGQKGYYLYVFHLMEGHFIKAANALLEDALHSPHNLASAIEKVKAGILFELGADTETARKTWFEVGRRFPESAYHFYGALAKRLASGQSDLTEEIPAGPHERSEMCYLAALLAEKRGNPNRCRELLRLSVSKDPTRRWPACLAAKRLEARQP